MLTLPLDADTQLRLFQAGDAPAYYALAQANRYRLRRWVPWLDSMRTVEDARRMLEMAAMQFEYDRRIFLGIWHQEALAGAIGLHTIDWHHKSAFIEYWLGEDFEGRGLVTRGCRVLLDHGFAVGLNRIEIRCVPGNLRSRAVPERLGFVQEGLLRQAEWLYDHFEDHLLFAMLKRDWQASSV